MTPEVPPYPNLDDSMILCQLLEFSCGLQEKSFLLQKQCCSSGQGGSGDGSSSPLFWFLSWSGLGLSTPASCGMAQQWGCPGGFQAITAHEWLPQKIACGPLPPLCIPAEEINLASPH